MCHGRDLSTGDFITSLEHHRQNDDSCKTWGGVSPEAWGPQGGHRCTTASPELQLRGAKDPAALRKQGQSRNCYLMLRIL